MINKFVSVSFLLSNKTSRPLENEIWSEEVKVINQAINKLSKIAKAGEIILISRSQRDADFYKSTTLETAPNIDVKIVESFKRSKEYVMHNLGWKAAIGDVLMHIDFTRNPSHLFIESLLDQLEMGSTHLKFITSKSSHFIQPLYRLLNHAYAKSGSLLLPENTIGFVATRQAINLAFSSQSEIDDPFINLALSGMTYSTYEVPMYMISRLKPSRYTKEDEFELLLTHAKPKYALMHLKHSQVWEIIVVFLLMAIVSSLVMISLGLGHDIMKVTMFATFINFLIIVFYEFRNRCHAIIVLQQHSLAASRDKNLVGQFTVTTL